MLNRGIHEILWQRAVATPDRLAFTFAGGNGRPDLAFSYAEVAAGAAEVARELGHLTTAGARVVLALAPGPDFVRALFGCFLAGRIAVPLYPPASGDRRQRFLNVVADCNPELVITSGDLAETVAKSGSTAPTCQLAPARDAFDPAAFSRVSAFCDLALLQYTSGSTGAPKGVMIGHGNLLANLAVIARAFQHTEHSKGVSWLPPYHDMGLVGGILQPVFAGFPVTLLTPQQFLADPLEWLRRISAERATTSGGPNFAFELCRQRASVADLASLDLSSLKVCFTGSESIQSETIQGFSETFAPAGFDQRMFYPCYGLAEATLMVSGGDIQADPLRSRLSVRGFDRGTVHFGAGAARTLVSCGPIRDSLAAAIIDPDLCREMDAGKVGEIWIRGSSVAQGYWRNPALTAATFEARPHGRPEGPTYLRTGDLGLIWEDELFVVGRLKELIIIAGQKFSPEDIEQHARAAGSIGAGVRTVAFGDELADRPGIILVQELPGEGFDKVGFERSVREAISRHFGIRVSTILFVRRAAIPVTRTGKIRRLEAASKFREQGRAAALAPVAVVSTDTEPEAWRSLLGNAENLLGRPLANDELDRPLRELGFDSLSLTSLAVAVSRISGLAVSGDFHHRTLRECLQERSGAEAPAQSRALTAAQTGLLYVEQTDALRDANSLVGMFAIEGSIEAAVIRAAAEQLVERHPVLGCRVAPVGGRAEFVRAESSSLDFQSGAPSGSTDAEVLDWLHQEAGKPFSLDQHSPMRIRFAKTERRAFLLIVFHHVAVDHWSLRLLSEEFWERVAGTAVARQIAAPSFFEFAHETECNTSRPTYAEGLAYWTQKLAGSAMRSDFSRHRERQVGCRVRHLDFELDGAAIAQLCRVSEGKGHSEASVVLATFQAMLRLQQSSDEVVLGSTVSLRGPRYARTVGYFVNIVVQRTRIPLTVDAAGAIAMVSAAWDESRRHADIPLSEVVRATSPDRSGRHPYFAVLFNFVATTDAAGAEDFDPTLHAARPFQVSGLRVSPLEHKRESAQYEFAVHVFRSRRGYAVRFEFDPALYDEEVVFLAAERWRTLITHWSQEPQVPLELVRWVPSAERARLDAFNHTHATPDPVPAFLRFEENRRHLADKVAIVNGQRQITFSEFGSRVDRVSAALRQQGIKPGHVVGAAFERSIELLVAVWGILKAGAAFLPLDPQLPAERVQGMLQRAQVSGVLVPTRQEDMGVRQWSLPELEQAGQALAVPSWAQDSNRPAYVLFTSGSTGQPKGVVNTVAGILNRLRWMERDLRMKAGDVVAQKTSITFDVSVWELLLPSIAGCTMAIVSREAMSDQNALHREISAAGVTTLHFVPSVLKRFLPACQEVGPPPSIRTVICSGESLERTAKDAFFNTFGHEVALWNLYGPTEASIDVTAVRLFPADEIVTIGRPVENTRIHIMEGSRQMPIGVTGELCIAGIQIATGYLNDPQLTAERFVVLESGERVYRTGDFARWRPDGQIEYLGRMDDQIKIRGVRIELAEVENALVRQPQVKAAAVVPVRNSDGESELHAYVELAADVTESILRQELRKGLLEAMVPKRYFKVDQLPLTASGKLDRREIMACAALPLVEEMSAGPAALHYPELMDMFAAILNAPVSSPDLHFFSLGVHSLQMVLLMNQVSERFGVTLSLAEVMREPTITGLDKLIASQVAPATEADEQIVSVLI